MTEYDTGYGKVDIVEVERVIRQDGDVSIMRLQSQRLEALEETVVFLRDSGLFTPIVDYQEVEGPDEPTGIKPRRIYLACPAPVAEKPKPSN